MDRFRCIDGHSMNTPEGSFRGGMRDSSIPSHQFNARIDCIGGTRVM